MSNVWITSDTHFGHKNIVKGVSDWADTSNCRDFDSIEEHDYVLINEINDRVKPGDVLWHLGDVGFGFAWKERFKELREQIKCRTIHLILGNHDHVFECEKYPELNRLFHSVRKLWYGKVCNRSMVFCHYAMRTWPWQHHNSIHCFGHSHSSLPDDPTALSMDVGMDTCLFGHQKYTPYNIEEIFEIMDKYKNNVPVDHHK